MYFFLLQNDSEYRKLTNMYSISQQNEYATQKTFKQMIEMKPVSSVRRINVNVHIFPRKEQNATVTFSFQIKIISKWGAWVA